MQENYKNLGQVAPGGGVLTTAYTCAGQAAVISSIVVCNTSGSGGQPGGTIDYLSVSHAVNGAPNSIKQYIYWQVELVPQDTFIATVGLSLSNGDVLRVESSFGNLSFNIYGTELD